MQLLVLCSWQDWKCEFESSWVAGMWHLLVCMSDGKPHLEICPGKQMMVLVCGCVGAARVVNHHLGSIAAYK
jgi:hypothetical protein